MYQIILVLISCTFGQFLQSLNNTEVSFLYITHEQEFDKLFNNLVEENSDINLKLNSIKVSKSLEFIDKSLICENNPSIIFDLTSNELQHLNPKRIDIPYIKVPSLIERFFEPIQRFIVDTGKYDAVVIILSDNENGKYHILSSVYTYYFIFMFFFSRCGLRKLIE